MKLYEIANDYKGLLSSDLKGDELIDCLDCIEDAFKDKAENILAVNETLKSNIAAIDEQIKRLQARKKAATNNMESLRDYLRVNMESTGISKIESPLFTITLGRPSKKAEVVDIDALPDEFVSVVTQVKPDLKSITEALKEGDVEGAALIDAKPRLTIR